MTGKKIIFYILAAFISGNLFIIYIQYNSAKNTTALIEGNEKVLSELNVSNNLKELEKDIISVESKIRGTVSTTDLSYIDGLEIKINEIENNLHQLQKISDDDYSIKYIDQLDDLIHKKLLFSRQILDVYQKNGQAAAEAFIVKQAGKKITDSISGVTFLIDSTRKTLLTKVTNSINKSGKKVQQLNTILIALVLGSGLILFWYIINTVRKQNQLIQRLNISEKKVKEAAKIKEKFMANMSHEIRTPMNAILGFTNLLDRKDIDAESKVYVQTIQKSGENLLAIINDILDLSKIEEGMMRIESAPFSIRALVHSVEIMFRSKAAEKRLQFLITVDELLPDIIEGDGTRLTQILVNLIGNALKFTESGSIEIKISHEGSADKIINTGIAVTDTGIGIEQDKLEKIFERFQQAEDTVTRKYGGTGLGLSIVNDLVMLQKGTVTVESVFGKGTTFKIIIPYTISSQEFDKIQFSSRKTFIQSNFKNTCVLVAEDNEINQSFIRHLFKTWQLNFDLVRNGKQAIEMLAVKKYSLILMDIQMPEMDGYTASQEIRNKLKLNIPIIAMTAHALTGEREKCLSFGMNEYISKPIREELLHQLITQFTYKEPSLFSVKQQTQIIDAVNYKFINLQYMKEVSNGNFEYEKTVTEQFIEIIPNDLLALQNAWQQHNIKKLKQLAHNMKTSISVMGLNEVLQPFLHEIEYEDLTDISFNSNFSSLRTICEASVEEAKHFYNQLPPEL